jgi:hypothetical protein
MGDCPRLREIAFESCHFAAWARAAGDEALAEFALADAEGFIMLAALDEPALPSAFV